MGKEMRLSVPISIVHRISYKYIISVTARVMVLLLFLLISLVYHCNKCALNVNNSDVVLSTKSTPIIEMRHVTCTYAHLLHHQKRRKQKNKRPTKAAETAVRPINLSQS